MRSFASLPERTRLVLVLVLGMLLWSVVFYMHAPYGHGDIDLYHRYALAFWAGPHALRALPAEYPLLSLVSFTLTVVPPLADYITVFALWMLGLFVLFFLAVARRVSPRAAEVTGVYLTVGAFATVLGRFDLVPAAITVLAYWAARERRFNLAYVLLAVGALVKLYPALLLPIVAIEQYRSLRLDPFRSAPPRTVLKGVGLFCVVVAAGFAVALALNPSGWLGPFTYNSRRPLQVESVPASLLWASSMFGFWISPNRSFHSFNLVGQLDGPISALSLAALLAGLVWVYWRQASGRLDFGRALTLCLLVVICTGRVLSPQYLIWVLPLIAIVEQEYDPLWLVICGLTSLIFPYAYEALHAGPGTPVYPPAFLGLIALRNVLLVGATLRFARRSPATARAEVPELAQRSVA